MGATPQSVEASLRWQAPSRIVAFEPTKKTNNFKNCVDQ